MYYDEQTRCGHNDFGQFMDIFTIAMMFHIMFVLLNQLYRLNMQRFRFMGRVRCFINVAQ
jgi:hypothetical protein